jgi:hypothetical protein
MIEWILGSLNHRLAECRGQVRFLVPGPPASVSHSHVRICSQSEVKRGLSSAPHPNIYLIIQRGPLVELAFFPHNPCWNQVSTPNFHILRSCLCLCQNFAFANCSGMVCNCMVN